MFNETRIAISELTGKRHKAEKRARVTAEAAKRSAKACSMSSSSNLAAPGWIGYYSRGPRAYTKREAKRTGWRNLGPGMQRSAFKGWERRRA